MNNSHFLFFIFEGKRFTVESSELKIDPLCLLNENEGDQRNLIELVFEGNV